MNTNEAAKAMIDGEICYCKGYGYIWDGLGFTRLKNNNEDYVRVNFLPSSEEWAIAKKLIKYSKEIWLYEEPNMESDSHNLPNYLFGCINLSWDIKKYNENYKKYKITVEEIEEWE